MDPASLHRIGRIGKPWGHLGHLSLHLKSVDPENLEHRGTLFLDIEGQRIPFFYTELREKSRGLVLIKFDDVDDPQAGAVLVGCEVHAPPGLLADTSDQSWDPDELVGVVVEDEKHGELGEVLRIEGNAENPLMVVLHGDHEVLVPLTDDWILGIDPVSAKMRVRTPPGLLDMNR